MLCLLVRFGRSLVLALAVVAVAASCARAEVVSGIKRMVAAVAVADAARPAARRDRSGYAVLALRTTLDTAARDALRPASALRADGILICPGYLCTLEGLAQ
jgi:hypothetical protein